MEKESWEPLSPSNDLEGCWVPMDPIDIHSAIRHALNRLSNHVAEKLDPKFVSILKKDSDQHFNFIEGLGTDQLIAGSDYIGLESDMELDSSIVKKSFEESALSDDCTIMRSRLTTLCDAYVFVLKFWKSARRQGMHLFVMTDDRFTHAWDGPNLETFMYRAFLSTNSNFLAPLEHRWHLEVLFQVLWNDGDIDCYEETVERAKRQMEVMCDLHQKFPFQIIMLTNEILRLRFLAPIAPLDAKAILNRLGDQNTVSLPGIGREKYITEYSSLLICYQWL